MKFRTILFTACIGVSLITQASAAERKVIPGVHDCLSAQGLPVEISENIVHIFGIDNRNRVWTGTGWIARDSGDANNPYNRIITARHVVAPVSQIGIVASDGTYLGTVIAASKSHTGLNDDNGSIAVTNDLAVLEIQSLTKEGQHVFPTLKGIPIARIQSPGLMHGDFNGIDHGASGAPVINGHGEAIGVLTQGAEIVGGPLQQVQATDEVWNESENRFDVVRDTVNLPKSNYAWIDTLDSEDLTFAVGMAGTGIRDHRLDTNAIIAGFPWRKCMVYHGHVQTK